MATIKQLVGNDGNTYDIRDSRLVNASNVSTFQDTDYVLLKNQNGTYSKISIGTLSQIIVPEITICDANLTYDGSRTVNVPSDGATKTFYFDSNVECTCPKSNIVPSQSWCTVISSASENTKTEDHNFTIRIDENTSTSTRSCTINICDKLSFSVTQEPAIVINDEYCYENTSLQVTINSQGWTDNYDRPLAVGSTMSANDLWLYKDEKAGSFDIKVNAPNGCSNNEIVLWSIWLDQEVTDGTVGLTRLSNGNYRVSLYDNGYTGKMFFVELRGATNYIRNKYGVVNVADGFGIRILVSQEPSREEED